MIVIVCDGLLAVIVASSLSRLSNGDFQVKSIGPPPSAPMMEEFQNFQYALEAPNIEMAKAETTIEPLQLDVSKVFCEKLSLSQSRDNRRMPKTPV